MVEAPAHSHPKLVRSSAQDEQAISNDSIADRRAHRRLTTTELAQLNHARIKYGPDVALIDLSAGGAQIETTSHALQPGSAVVIELAVGERTWPVPARVLRCHIAALAPHPIYRGGLVFKRPVNLQEIAGVVQPTVDINAMGEYARLNLALNRVGELRGTGTFPLSATGKQALGTTFAMIESARRRASAAPFITEVGALLHLLTVSLETASDPAAIEPEIVSKLHRTVPSLTVRVVDASHAALIRSDAVYFRVPTQGVETTDCLMIEFPDDCALEAWHLQLLEAGAQLIGVSKDLASELHSDLHP